MGGFQLHQIVDRRLRADRIALDVKTLGFYGRDCKGDSALFFISGSSNFFEQTKGNRGPDAAVMDALSKAYRTA